MQMNDFFGKEFFAKKNLILKLYGVAAAMLLFLSLYGVLNLRVNVQRDKGKTGYEFVGNVSQTTVRDESAICGEKIFLAFRIEGVQGDRNSIVFYTSHQNVKVFLSGKCIYQAEAVPGVLLPRSPGRLYNLIELEETDNGKELQIELEPVYPGAAVYPDVLFGSRYSVVSYLIHIGFLTVLLSIVAVVVGLALLIFAIIGKTANRRSLLYLGAFSILIGIWKIFDCNIIGLFCARVPYISVIPFFSLMLLPCMAVGYIRSLVSEKKSVVWDIPDVVTLCSNFVIILLQVFGVADYWESLWIIQAGLVLTSLCMLIGLVQVIRKYGWNKNVKTGFGAAVSCAVWMLIDMSAYYGSRGLETFPVSTLIFLVFLLYMALDRLRLSKARMEVGMQARQYKKLAYHDALTGFFNRAAYTDYIASREFAPDKSVMVAFDLNNLKKCNDELGHDKGDIYIKESAKIIMDCFGEKGRCYRLGGDEFGAILSGASIAECAKCAERMKAKVDRFNKASNDIFMGIACGYAVFDAGEDEDIYATIRRADKMMYEEKFRMKQKLGGNGSASDETNS